MPICPKCRCGFDHGTECPKCGNIVQPADPQRLMRNRSNPSARGNVILLLAEIICWFVVAITVVMGIYGCFVGSNGSIISTDASRLGGLLAHLLSTAISFVIFSALAIAFGRVRLMK